MHFNQSIHTLAGIAFICLAVDALPAQEQMAIWPENSPELSGVAADHAPVLYLYPGPKSENKKPAVLICPAGGYKHHSDQSRQIRWLNENGMAVYVVKYRLPVHGYKHPAPLHDAQRAMRILRKNAEPWGLDIAKIGVYGGSSGGHVASTLATHFDSGDKSSSDPLEHEGCRPAFVILTDAVVTLQGNYCHRASLSRLLPAEPPKELVDSLSNELQVTSATPPTFLVAGGQDGLVPAENSLLYFQALRENGVAFSELHFLSHGGHGFQTPEEWHLLAESWLKRLNVLPVKDGEKNWPAQFETGAWGRKTSP